jgi:chromodomain-helicase-DNA-binding protein 1
MQRCNAAIEEYKANPAAAVIKEESASNTPAQSETGGDGPGTPGADAKKKKPPKEKGPSFKLAGVMVNAKTLTSAIEELAPLGDYVPKDDAARKTWKFDLKTKTALYDSEWGPEEDTRLLVGIWEHGMGNWEAIRESDPLLKEKIFAEGDKKPQFKHVCTRGEYLIKVIKKHLALTQPAAAKVRKKRADKKKDATDIKLEPGAVAVKEESTDAPKEDNAPKDAKSKVRKPRKKKDPGPMHFSAAADPTPLNVLGELDPRSFNECKEKMRPVKKALKSLDNPDPNLTEKEQVRHTRSCLIQIGDQIQTCLATYKDPNDARQWKSLLWYFVSKFTEYDAHKLHKLYRKAIRKDDSDDSPTKPAKGKEKNKEKSKDKPNKRKRGSGRGNQ